MRFINARQCVHDAFASNLGTPDPSTKGGTRYNADNTIAHQTEAGLIIRAALEQPPHLRAACLFINAPEATANGADFAALKMRLWRDIHRDKKDWFTVTRQSIFVAMVDYVLINYRDRVHNPIGAGKQRHVVISDVLRVHPGEIEPLVDVAWKYLSQYDGDSLQPVWHVVNEQREKYDLADQQAVGATGGNN